MDIFIIVVACILVGATVFVLWKPKGKEKEKDFNYYVNVPLQYTIDQLAVPINEIKKVDPDFDPNYFLFTTYCLFRDTQKAWSDRDLVTLKKYIGSNLYEVYEKVIKGFLEKGQKNNISDILLLNSKLCSVSIEGGKETAEVLLTISCYDYLVATSSHLIITGNSDRKLAITYLLKLEKVGKEPDTLAVCPNCKQMMKEKHLIRCPFCNSELNPTSYQWIIINKRVLKQTEF